MLARCEWITQKSNCCFVDNHGTWKNHISISLEIAACRAGLRVRFFTAAELVSRLEKEQKQYTLDRFLAQLDRAHLLICDELGYVSMSRGGWSSPRKTSAELTVICFARTRRGTDSPATSDAGPGCRTLKCAPGIGPGA